MAEIVIYCDGISDELAAEQFLRRGPLRKARVERLPRLAEAPAILRPLLSWERIDWVVVKDESVCCTIELSRHGYTGDHGFQRFARLFRSASLGVPTIYFTPFSRTRLNEMDDGGGSPRNVAPELFETLFELEEQFDVPCLAIDWPVRDDGQPSPLGDRSTLATLNRLAELVAAIVEAPASGTRAVVADEFPGVVEGMRKHAALPYRGGDTRGTVALPIDVGAPEWVYDFLPETYFAAGKAEKTLASLALDSCSQRPVSGGGGSKWWAKPGEAWVQYLGYQWRPDPSCGLIALSATKARALGVPLIVVWPRVFSSAQGKRLEMLAALDELKRHRRGPLASEMRKHGRTEQIEGFSKRVSVRPGQFGVFSSSSKIGRVLEETASALVLGDEVLLFKAR